MEMEGRFTFALVVKRGRRQHNNMIYDKNISIIDYLKSVGQPTDFPSRANLANMKGIPDYQGTAQQNAQLLEKLQNFKNNQRITW
jgi:GAF domain-containing protein